MVKQTKSSYEQLFNIAKAISQDVLSAPDSELLEEARKDSFTKNEGVMAKNAYLKALETTGFNEHVNADSKASSFNLADTLLKGMSLNVVRKSLAGLMAANDPSLQLIASKANALSDLEALEIYNKLLVSGVIKTDSNN